MFSAVVVNVVDVQELRACLSATLAVVAVGVEDKDAESVAFTLVTATGANKTVVAGCRPVRRDKPARRAKSGVTALLTELPLFCTAVSTFTAGGVSQLATATTQALLLCSLAQLSAFVEAGWTLPVSKRIRLRATAAQPGQFPRVSQRVLSDSDGPACPTQAATAVAEDLGGGCTAFCAATGSKP